MVDDEERIINEKIEETDDWWARMPICYKDAIKIRLFCSSLGYKDLEQFEAKGILIEEAKKWWDKIGRGKDYLKREEFYEFLCDN